MTRRLVLLRHGTAEPTQPGGDDRDRRLTPQGRAEATRVGAWLAGRGLHPDNVVASSAPRALETARLAGAALGVDADDVSSEPALYGIEPAALLRRLGSLAGRCVLVVGHNPAIEAVALHLSGDEDLERRPLPPAGCVVLDLPEDWGDLGARSAAAWTIVDPGLL